MYRENPFRNFLSNTEEPCAEWLWWYISIYTILAPSPAWNDQLSKAEKCISSVVDISPPDCINFSQFKNKQANQTKQKIVSPKYKELIRFWKFFLVLWQRIKTHFFSPFKHTSTEKLLTRMSCLWCSQAFYEL